MEVIFFGYLKIIYDFMKIENKIKINIKLLNKVYFLNYWMYVGIF